MRRCPQSSREAPGQKSTTTARQLQTPARKSERTREGTILAPQQNILPTLELHGVVQNPREKRGTNNSSL
eukprot:10725107-Lingulodinium_polyedra.AAC.1